MKKLVALCLCLCLLSGCMALPAFSTEGSVEEALSPTAAPAVTAEPVLAGTAAPAETTPQPMPEVTLSPAPVLTEAPTASPRPIQTYTGTYFRFDVPGDWLRADMDHGVCFYPDPDDMQHTCLFYAEAANDLKLTETTVDIALLFSSPEAITSMVEGALTGSGMTGFHLSPVDIQKTRLNGIPCYHGASDVVVDGESYDFEGYVFLRKDKLVLLVWVGDQVRYADQLQPVYDSLQAVR